MCSEYVIIRKACTAKQLWIEASEISKDTRCTIMSFSFSVPTYKWQIPLKNRDMVVGCYWIQMGLKSDFHNLSIN